MRSRFLLSNHRLQFQAPKLHICAQTKQTLSTTNERRLRGHRHITRLNEFDNLVFLPLVAQFEILCIKVERGFRVVVEVHIHLVTHLSVERKIHLFVEVKAKDTAITLRQGRIVRPSVVCPQFQFCTSLRAYSYTSWAENFLCGSERKLHIGEIKFVFSLTPIFLFIAISEIVEHRAADAFAHHFVCAHIDGRIHKMISHFCAIFIESCRFIVKESRDKVVRIFQIARVGFVVFRVAARCWAHFERHHVLLLCFALRWHTVAHGLCSGGFSLHWG